MFTYGTFFLGIHLCVILILLPYLTSLYMNLCSCLFGSFVLYFKNFLYVWYNFFYLDKCAWRAFVIHALGPCKHRPNNHENDTFWGFAMWCAYGTTLRSLRRGKLNIERLSLVWTSSFFAMNVVGVAAAVAVVYLALMEAISCDVWKNSIHFRITKREYIILILT